MKHAPYPSRIKRIRKTLQKLDLDTLMVSVQENRRYLSGFTAEDTQFDESAGVLFITQSRLILATDSRFETQAAREAPLFEVFCYREGLAKSLPEILGSLRTERMGFEGIRLCVREYERMQGALKKAGKKVTLLPVTDVVEGSRQIKSAAEIKAIERAVALAEKAFQRTLEIVQPGITEKEAAWALEQAMREDGAEGVSFPVIAAFGENSALPHAVPGNRRLSAGDPVLFDWGARLDGYCSDISRSFCLKRPGSFFKKVFKAVREAQERAVAAVRPGAHTRSIDKIARNRIHRAGFKGRFGHGLGHGVGLAVHESPRVGPARDAVLAPGMVFTVEPGIYIPRWGGVRLENMVVVEKDGARVLNRLETFVEI